LRMKIFAIGFNYPSHTREMKGIFTPRTGFSTQGAVSTTSDSDFREKEKEVVPFSDLQEPIFFMKPDTALLQRGRPFFLPDFSEEVHYEMEVVVKIDRLGKNIAERFAHRYYSEVTVGIDFTARDIQRRQKERGLPWEIAKSFDNSAAIGTFVSKSDFEELSNLDFHLDINGKMVQRGNTSDMIFTVDKIISYISRFFTLKVGDILFTGTPAGVGSVAINDHLQGYLGGQKLLDFRVK
jgi:fumarylpyruvate hydrolase